MYMYLSVLNKINVPLFWSFGLYRKIFFCLMKSRGYQELDYFIGKYDVQHKQPINDSDVLCMLDLP